MEKIEIYKDRMGNLYRKTKDATGFMIRIMDETRHDGTTTGDFFIVKNPISELLKLINHQNRAEMKTKIKINTLT